MFAFEFGLCGVVDGDVVLLQLFTRRPPCSVPNWACLALRSGNVYTSSWADENPAVHPPN